MSCWSNSGTRFPVLKNDISADVVVIGAGITGASVSYWLGNKCKTVLLESDTVASKASSRNAGFLLTGTSAYYNRAIKLYGHRKSKAIWSLSRQNHALLQRHILRNNIECEYKRSGSYLVATTKREMNDLITSTTLMKRDGFNYNIIGEKDINERLSSKSFYGAAFNERDGEINPVKFVRGLVKTAASTGTNIFENSKVNKIEMRKNIFKIKTKYGKIRADYLVLATNAYSPLVYPYLRSLILPVRGQMLVTKPCKDFLDGVFYANYGYEYWRQLLDKRIIVGGFREIDPLGETGYLMVTRNKIQKKLEGLLHELSIKSAITCKWSGIMGFTKDQLPIIGSLQNRKNLLISAGYSGHGLAFSFIAGKMLGEKILHNKFNNIFSPERFHLDINNKTYLGK